MSHIVGKSAYKSLEERLNRFPQGAPPSKVLYQILEILFSEKEASLVAQLPIKPFTLKKAASIWRMSEKEAKNILDGLASRAIILDIVQKGVQTYILPPPMAGFIEFSMMRTRGDIDQHLLGELLYQYMNVEEDFIKMLFFSSETKLGRVFVNEEALKKTEDSKELENLVQILDYERASHIIESSEHMGISMCYCRHKMQHVGKACDAPLDICMTFGNVANSLINNGYARRVDKIEGIDLLQQAYESNLVQCGENVREGVTFICNCCGCCCEALVAAKKFGVLHPVETTNFLPKISYDTCINCGRCLKACPVNAIKKENGIIVIQEELCLGCGVCGRNCPKSCILLMPRENKIITPVNSVHRSVLMAIEKGMLQELIFDNKALYSHRAMAAILGVILKLSPVQKLMASKQMKSIYLEKLLKNY
ncbi:4Fe-4S binding protein [Cetobacterium sp. 8H]|uniref:4Fe-4S dicluster domain-containing protein n=1 Tax=Cetobacterium sp. 8H TaxID=2759681 RepID=UPI00163C87E0|nr:4Fe-4S dicluster-binding protein [Cetobacterium sp. 8H]MBC2850037.1 4Fe-4S binding protein [Cetobacterium sp. 8H]